MYSQGDSTGDKGKLEIQALPESRTLRRRFRLMAGDGDVLGLDWLCVSGTIPETAVVEDIWKRSGCEEEEEEEGEEAKRRWKGKINREMEGVDSLSSRENPGGEPSLQLYWTELLED